MALQLTFDCADPNAQARFWAAALDYDVEDHDELIGQAVEAGHLLAPTARTSSRSLAGGRGVRTHRPRRATPRSGCCSRWWPRPGQPRTPPPRLHPGEDQGEAKVAQLLELGATKLWDGRLGPQTWVTLADPEGNEFCVA